MIIRGLKLSNFRVFEGTRTFEFAEDFTVIAGVNGRGKTSIIDAIRFSAGRLIPQISKARGQYPKITKYDVNRKAEDGTFTIDLASNCAGYPVNFKLAFDHSSNWPTPTRLPKSVADTIRDAYGDDPSTDEDAAPLVVCYTTDRAAFRLPKKLPKEIPPLDKAAFGGALVNRTVDYKDLAYRLAALEAEAIHPGQTAMRMHSAITRVIAAVLDGFDNLRLVENPLGILINKAGETLELFQLSDGERSLLAMAADLSRRLTLANPQLEDPLDRSGVALIDELELHLHPKWQRTIVQRLRSTFPNIQFICTTHSPFIIQSLQPGELVALDNEIETEYSDRSIEDIAENVMKVPMPQKSERYRLMIEAAEKYFIALHDAQHLSGASLRQAKLNLDRLAEPFSDDPAYHAMLRAERALALGDDQ